MMFVNALNADFFSAYCPVSCPPSLFLSSLERVVGRNRRSRISPHENSTSGEVRLAIPSSTG
jgi:hypothetical protein